MRARTMIAALLMGALVLGTGSAAWARAGVEDRQMKQRGLIFEGLRSGEITEEEFSRLDQEQYGIETQRRRAVSDGHLSQREAQRLHRELNRAQENIQVARRNHHPPRKHDRWRWDPRYDRYRYHDYWDRYYGRGYYRWDHYRPRIRPYHRRPPDYGPRGYLHFGIHEPGFGLEWSIGVE